MTQSTGQLPRAGCLSILAPCAHHTLDHATCLLLQTHHTLGAEFSLLFLLWTPKFQFLNRDLLVPPQVTTMETGQSFERKPVLDM